MLLAARYGSDVIVDLLKGFEIQYAALNPGATYRGLHDSIVNYGGNCPEIVTCTHEEIAVAIAHGYTKVTGKPMAAIVHDVVGLLHSSMAIYYAHIDRVRVLVLGATGPLDRSKRRPYIDWIHSALVQGNAVRDFVKWDDQPASVADFAPSFARGYRIATTEPAGPVYLCYDAGLQEDELVRPVSVKAEIEAARPTPAQADPRALADAAKRIAKAERPGIGAFPPVDLAIVGDSALALPALRELISADASPAWPGRRGRLEQENAKLRAEVAKKSREHWDDSPIWPARLASEVWDAIRGEDWVLSANDLEDWAWKLWDIDSPARWPGRSLGTATQIGISIRVALAHRGDGKLIVDIQPHGDLLFDPGALWTAANLKLPMLLVMYNNRAYYNDWEHQLRVADKRGTDKAKANIGMDLSDPAPDFAMLARSFGWYAEGPIDDPKDVRPALRRAIEVIHKEGRPALLDTIVRKRELTRFR